MEQNFASILKNLEGKADICGGHQPGGLFRPFHQANIVSVEIVTESGTLPFFGIAKAIQVEVPQV